MGKVNLVRKSKNSDTLCRTCPHINECDVYKKFGSAFDVLSCPFTEPQPEDNVEEFKPRKGDK
jgi:hypothetical protein